MLQEEIQKLENEHQMLKRMAATQNPIAQGQTVDGGESIPLFERRSLSNLSKNACNCLHRRPALIGGRHQSPPPATFSPSHR